MDYTFLAQDNGQLLEWIQAHPIFALAIMAGLMILGMYFPVAKPFIDALILIIRGKNNPDNPVIPDDLDIIDSPTKMLAWLRARIRRDHPNVPPDPEVENALDVLEKKVVNIEIKNLEQQYKDYE